MRVLLMYPRISSGNPPWIPLGIAYIAAYLRKHGIDVKIIDNNLHRWNKERLSILINEYKPDIVGTGGTTVHCNDAVEMGRIIKSINENLKLVYGGVHFTFLPKEGLRYGDICIIGEGEHTFLEICREDNPYKIKGIAFKERNNIVFTEQRPLINNLDEIPFPAYNLLEMDKYCDALITGERAVSIMTGRGCPYNCVFCGSPRLWRRRVRFHSLDYVMSHIKYLIENYDLKNLRIMDDTFTVNKERVFEFCDEIEKNQFKLNMTCLTNVKNSDFEMFKRMKEVGFSIIAFGIESGNDNILQMINKGITVNDARRAIVLAKKAGLDRECLLMIGNIGENRDTIMDSINFAKEVNPVGSNSNRNVRYNYFQFATPFPGSEFFEIWKQYGCLTTANWDNYYSQKPIFIPNGLDKNIMVKLRNLALDETNLQKVSWITKKVKRNTLVSKVYRNLMMPKKWLAKNSNI